MDLARDMPGGSFLPNATIRDMQTLETAFYWLCRWGYVMSSSIIIQFNWRRNWKKKVAPYLQEERVQAALDAGMSLYKPTWKRGDAPYLCGGVGGRKVVEGKLSWYQPVGRCHYIALFSFVIGLINYPDLTWSLLTSKRHTVPVGYGKDGEPRVVMDILNFTWCSGEQSLEFADPRIPDEQFWASHSQRFGVTTPPSKGDTNLDSGSH